MAVTIELAVRLNGMVRSWRKVASECRGSRPQKAIANDMAEI